MSRPFTAEQLRSAIHQHIESQNEKMGQMKLARLNALLEETGVVNHADNQENPSPELLNAAHLIQYQILNLLKP